jgi:amino acid adenylation domain-containing protein
MQEQVQGYRLSPQQRRLWLLQRGAIFPAQCVILLEGELNEQALQEALHNVIRRHEILRTAFRTLPGRKIPLQSISLNGSSTWDCARLNALPDSENADQWTSLERLSEQERKREIDCAIGPLIRSLLVKISAGRHALMITLPALCADSRALKALVGEISQAYGAGLPNEEDSNEPVQYLQFSEWQNELLIDDDAEVGFQYWRKLGVPDFSSSALPFPSVEGVGKTSGGEFLLPCAALKRLDERAGEWQIDAQAFLMAAWQAFLFRLTAEACMVVGYQCEGRKIEELRDTQGLFSKVVPVHLNLAGSRQFYEAAKETSQAFLGACAWQEYFAAEEFVDAGQDKSFAVGFEYGEWPPVQTVHGVRFSLLSADVKLECYKLKLKCERKPESLSLEISSERGIEESDLRRLSEAFVALLESTLDEPEASIEDLNILPEAQRAWLIEEFNDTQEAGCGQSDLRQLFERQAERSPDEVAAECNGAQLTFRQLDEQANQLANYLRRAGVGPEIIVGVCVERSLELIVALLGVIKAGGAYLPLDPFYPKERLRYMLEDSGASILLVKSRKDGLPVEALKAVSLNEDWEMIVRESKASPPQNILPENLAYLIYTSGSTGLPKGVMVTHRGLANYLDWCARAYKVEEGNGAPVHSPVSFDLTITGLFAPLIKGKPVRLLPEEQGIEGLSAIFCEPRNYSLVKITPAHLNLLTERLRDETVLAQVGALIIGGEALYGESLKYWQQHAPQTRLINEYGPTETVVGCCVFEVRGELTGAVPIGRPIANTQLYLLDERLRLAPIGATGELYIGGAGLARGYHKRADITAERFIPNPFSAAPGARLYKTGDLARFGSDGEIEFLGRNDDQVKVKGYRIELAEIESVLERLAGVKQAVVTVREEEPQEKRLVAYLVTQSRQPHHTHDIRDQLRNSLPDYMVPSAFVMMDALPLTPNGKVDKRALPAPTTSRPDLHQSYIEPQNDAEKLIAAVWRQVLHLDRVGTNDNFFDLGGDSMLMLQVFSKLRTAFDKQLSMVELFQYPTIGALAEYAMQTQPKVTPTNQHVERIESRKQLLRRRSQLRETRQRMNEPSGE